MRRESVSLPVVYRDGPRRAGMVLLWSGPKPGLAKDDEGRLILVNHYGWPDGHRAASPAPIAAPAPPAPPRVSRGVQASLL